MAGVRAVLIGWGSRRCGHLGIGCGFSICRLSQSGGGIYTYARAGFGELVGFFCRATGLRHRRRGGIFRIAFAARRFCRYAAAVWFLAGQYAGRWIGESYILWAVHWLVSRSVQQAAMFNLVATLARVCRYCCLYCLPCYYFDLLLCSGPSGQLLAGASVWCVFHYADLWVFTGIEGAAVLSARAK